MSEPIDLETGRTVNVEEDVEQLIDGLEGADEVTAEDLERVRNELPTHPFLAELTQKALPYPWDEVFEFVNADPPYWRTKPRRDTPGHRRGQEALAEAAREASELGAEGTVEHDGKEIQANAAYIARRTEGSGSTVAESGRRALRRLRSLL